MLRLRHGVVLTLLLAACGGPATREEGPGARARARAETLPLAVPATAGELPASQLPAYLAAQQKALREALRPAADAGLLRVGNGRDGNPAVILSADAAFDRDSAQLRPQTLLPLTAIAGVLQRDRASVLHVIGFDPADGSLAERRALAAASVLDADGADPARVRAEARSGLRGGREPRLAFVFVPVVAGRAPSAWMPPAAE